MTPASTASNSRLPTLNPVARMLSSILVAIPLILTLDMLSAAFALVLELIAFLAVLRLPLYRVAKRASILLALAAAGGLGVAFYAAPVGTIYWQWWLITVSDNSLTLAIATILRVLALALPSVLFAMDLDATALADGLAQNLRLPARFVLGGLVGARLLQVFRSDWLLLVAARRARGVGGSNTLRSTLSAAFALLVIALRRGTQLAMAMEARGFGAPIERTWARPSTFRYRDWICMAGFLTIGVAAILVAVYAGTFRFVVTVGA